MCQLKTNILAPKCSPALSHMVMNKDTELRGPRLYPQGTSPQVLSTLPHVSRAIDCPSFSFMWVVKWT